MNPSIILTVWFVKIFTVLTKLFGYQASTLPGLIGFRLDSQLLDKLIKSYQGKLILISGTNGKTTTTKLIADFLSSSGKTLVTNSSGSNLERGILASLIKGSSWRAKLEQDYLVIEIDEAELARIVSRLDPNYLLVTNLSRDQLDRYGEIDSLATKIGGAIRSLDCQLIINGDDPLLASLKTTKPAIYYGFSFDSQQLPTSGSELSDIPYDIKTKQKIKYHNRYLGHLGDYYTDSHSLTRPKLDYHLDKLDLETGKLQINHQPLDTKLSGVYNYYNILASYSLICSLGYNDSQFQSFLPSFEPAPGRSQSLRLDGRELTIALAKNPVGMNQVISYVINSKQYQKVIILINDQIADGRDVSWLYDCDFQTVLPTTKLFAGGLRAKDLRLRLTVAGLESSLLEKLDKSSLLAKTDPDDRILIVPNYTAMQDVFEVIGQ